MSDLTTIEAPTAGEHLSNLINGELVGAVSGSTLVSENPSTGDPHVHLPLSGKEDAENAVSAAHAAFPVWSSLPAEKRAEYMNKIADIIESNLEAFAACESRDQGKPVSLARAVDIPRAVKNFRFFAQSILQSRHGAVVSNSAIHVESPIPVGVCALVSPWNLPLYLLTWKIAPCMASGCTMVAKPSEMTPATAFMLSKAIIAAGVPPGVVNIVHGTGPDIGPTICGDERIAAVSFTGGTATAKHIVAQSMTGAKGPIKKLSLELGGKNPAVIFADANFDRAVAGTVRSSFANQGEICLCTSRILVQRPIFEKFLAAFVEKAKAIKVGDPADADTQCGALISQAHCEKVQSFIDLAKGEGATIHCGGGRPEGLPEKLAKGHYIAPTIVTGLEHSSKVVQEEIFGPCVVVIPFDSEEEAVSMANGVKYGLAATVWSDSSDRAQRVARKMHAGNVWVNCWMVRDLRQPFGGMKASGLGREGGAYSMEFFTEARDICFAFE